MSRLIVGGLNSRSLEHSCAAASGESIDGNVQVITKAEDIGKASRQDGIGSGAKGIKRGSTKQSAVLDGSDPIEIVITLRRLLEVAEAQVGIITEGNLYDYGLDQ